MKLYPIFALALTVVSLAALTGCDKVPDTSPSDTTFNSDETLAAALAGIDALDTVARAMSETGLSQVFDGAGSYTVFAPTDDAFARLGAPGNRLFERDNRAALVAVLRDHVVPGRLMPHVIMAAIKANGGQAVQMRTVGDGTIAFTQQDGKLTMIGADGSVVHMAGPAMAASNGVAIPLDGLLKKLPDLSPG